MSDCVTTTTTSFVEEHMDGIVVKKETPDPTTSTTTTTTDTTMTTAMNDTIAAAVATAAPNSTTAAHTSTSAAAAAAAASNVQFPYRLHELLDEVDPSIITWLPDSNAFKVLDKHTFTGKTLPHYFNATKYKSFQRNLNLWGFQTIQDGPNKGACYHPLFIRGNREKVHYMSRQKVKGGMGSRGSIGGVGKMLMSVKTSHIDPTHAMHNLNNMNINGNLHSNNSSGNNLNGLHKMPLAPRGDLLQQQQQQQQQQHHHLHMTPTPTLAEIAVASHPGLMVALRDAKHSNLTDDELKALPFMKKLHHILAQPELGDSIAWTPDGRCVRVIDPFKFLDKVQNRYFDLDITSFSSFLVELESFGFKKVAHLGFSECYYHDLMIRGCPHLCKYIDDTGSAKLFVAKDPVKELEIDQAFGIPPLLPQAPLSTIIKNSETVVMFEHLRQQQQQQQMAAFQAMGNMVVNPNNMTAIGGINPPAFGLQHPGTTTTTPNAGSSSTPISNYLASNGSGGTSLGNATRSIGGNLGSPSMMVNKDKGGTVLGPSTLSSPPTTTMDL